MPNYCWPPSQITGKKYNPNILWDCPLNVSNPHKLFLLCRLYCIQYTYNLPLYCTVHCTVYTICLFIVYTIQYTHYTICPFIVYHSIHNLPLYCLQYIQSAPLLYSMKSAPFSSQNLTLTHAAKGPKGLSCFEKQTANSAKHFLKLNFFFLIGYSWEIICRLFFHFTIIS